MSDTPKDVSPINYYTFQVLTAREDQEHRERVDSLKRRLKTFQVHVCKHENTDYEPDAAGGHDSCIYCKDCNKVIK